MYFCWLAVLIICMLFCICWMVDYMCYLRNNLELFTGYRHQTYPIDQRSNDSGHWLVDKVMPTPCIGNPMLDRHQTWCCYTHSKLCDGFGLRSKVYVKLYTWPKKIYFEVIRSNHWLARVLSTENPFLFALYYEKKLILFNIVT